LKVCITVNAHTILATFSDAAVAAGGLRSITAAPRAVLPGVTGVAAQAQGAAELLVDGAVEVAASITVAAACGAGEGRAGARLGALLAYLILADFVCAAGVTDLAPAAASEGVRAALALVVEAAAVLLRAGCAAAVGVLALARLEVAREARRARLARGPTDAALAGVGVGLALVANATARGAIGGVAGA